MSRPIYAIGDIHGQKAQLDRALELIDEDGAAAPVVFVGDYVDRGPDSRGVLDTLIAGQAEGRDWVCLLGNHDLMLADFLAGRTEGRSRIGYLSDGIGGRETLRSYGVDARETRDVEAIRADAQDAVPQAHRDWLEALPRIHETGPYLFVHAGIRPGIALAEQDPDDLVWIRDAFLFDTRDHGALIVHGHTPQSLPSHHGNRINLDGGAGFGRPLFPVLLEDRSAHLLNGFGRSALLPAL